MPLPTGYYELAPGLYRGPRPTYALLKSGRLGERPTLINLERGWYERLHPNEPAEIDVAEELGLQEIVLPMADLWFPNRNKVYTAVCLMANELHRPMLVHCHTGVDRTGVVSAAFRVAVQAWSVKQALGEMFRLGFHRRRYWSWLPRIKKILREAERWTTTDSSDGGKPSLCRK